MRKLLPLFFALAAILFAGSVSEAQAQEAEPHQGTVICAPGVVGDCGPYGPAEYIRRLEAEGVRLPYETLSYRAPDINLNYLPYLYGQVVTGNAPVYGSMDDAARARNPIYRMNGQTLYISYEYTDVVDGMRVYMIAPGVWMNAVDVHRIGTPTFQGLEFTRTPRNPFGWILTPVETRTQPGYFSGAYTGLWLNRQEIVQVYSIEFVDGVEWLQIRQGEWVEKRFVGLVRPRIRPPAVEIADRWIEIDLYEQTIAAYEGGRLVFATMISSGIEPFWTRPGLFQIQEKLETTPMSGSFEADRSDYYYLEDVPWTMYYDEARALHGAYWHTGYGYPRSHGCVNLSPGDAHWLYEWAEVGDWVYVHDPSGQTPTDPSLYGSGGA
ncbi:MAG TPA: L,D-transpeptidase [Anaerolineales bacterium]|nr:L,D-transpeptidase [Anaerolineales bacterium]